MRTSRKLFALLLAVMFVVSCFTGMQISASAASGDTVYFDNSVTNFGTVYCYMWSGEGDPKNADWPGAQMTNVSGNVWSCEVKGDFEKIIFNGGQGQPQSVDIDYPGNNMIAVKNGEENGKFKVSWSAYSGGDTPTTPTQSGGAVEVYCKNDANWSDVYCYMWTGGAEDQNSGWPGAKMTNLGNGIFKYEAPKSYANVIFNSGSEANKTGDLTFPGSGQMYNNSTGQWSAYGGGDTPTQATQATQSTGSTTPYNPGQTDSDLVGYYHTNKIGVGAQKTITVDGAISDWDSSMLIAQGTANDDPRVYRPNSMYENPADMYALYGAYDSNNLYLMWEMTNVQDVVAPNDNNPLTQGFLYIDNLPIFIAIDTGKSDIIGNNGKTASGSFLWDKPISYQSSFNKMIAVSTNGANGPFIYGGDASGINPVELYNATTSGITFKYGKGIISQNVYGINKAYGAYNNRVVGDMCNPSADWVDFNTLGHNSSTMDYHYEMSIPLDKLGITLSDITSNGIGALVVTTFGLSGMDCLPYDLSMNDNADKDDSAGSQENNSFEKSDEDFVKTAFARIGKAGGSVTPTQATEATQATQPQTQATQPQTQATQPQTQATQPQTQATQPQTQATTQPSLTTSIKLNGSQVKSVNVSGNTLTVSYNLTASLPITDGDLALSYDSSKLTLSQVSMPKISGGYQAASPNTSYNPYLMNFTGINQSAKSGLYDFTNGGVLVQATFNVKSGASGTASVNLNVNELDALKNSVTTSYFSDAKATSVGQALMSSLSNPTVDTSGVIPTQATQPQTQATQPQTQATQPQTQATQPQTQSTDPNPTQSTQQPTGPQYQTSIVAIAESSKIYVGGSTYISVSLTNGVGQTKFTSNNTKVATVNSTTGKVTGKKAGTAIITAKNNNASSTVRITVVQKANPIKVTGKTVKIKAKKATTITKAKAYTIKNAKGTVTFKKSSGNSKFTVNKKNGKITVKKGLKKGTYKVKVKVTAKGNTTYKSGSKTATVKIVAG